MLIRVAILLIFFCASGSLAAQILPGTSGQGTGAPTIPVDTSQRDTTPERKVEVKVQVVSPEAIFENSYGRKDIEIDFPSFHYYEETEKMKGWIQSLGQTGKPVRRYVYGLPGQFLNENMYINPMSGVEEPYMMRQSQNVPFFNTRTPYVNVNYHQGPRTLSYITGTVSQNVTPFVNIAASYRHRRAEGVYFNNSTNDYNVYLSSYAHTYNNRFHLFVDGVYNQLDEELNGGTPTDVTFDSSFRKTFSDVNLQDANYGRRHSGVGVRGIYRFYSDSLELRNKFSISAEGITDRFKHSFVDDFYDQLLHLKAVRIYNTARIDSSNVYDELSTDRMEGKAGLSYRLDLDGVTFNATGKYGYSERIFNSIFRDVIEYKWLRELHSELAVDLKAVRLGFRGDAQLNTSNLYGDSRFIDAHASIWGGPKMLDFVTIDKEKLKADTMKWYEFEIHRPFRASFQYLDHSRNPDYLHKYHMGSGTNLFRPNENVVNQEARLLRATVSYTGKRRTRDDQVLDPMFIRIGAFRSSLNRAIYFDTAMVVQQAAQGEGLNWLGLELAMKLRWRRWFLSNTSYWQTNSVDGGGSMDGQFTDYVPPLHGNASLYYEHHNAKIAEIIKFGLELHYQSGFRPLYFDVSNQQFYAQPVGFQVPAYGRLDAAVITRIKGVEIYVRMVNILDEVVIQGYYTTPYYPMLERTFLFGLDWSFFD